MTNKDLFYIIYIIIGLAYWAINIWVRKFPNKDEYGDGWVIAPVWVVFWPICFTVLLIAYIQGLFKKGKL